MNAFLRRFSIICSLITSPVFAQQASATDSSPEECQQPLTAGYNAPCQMQTNCCWNAYLFASFTYFHPVQDNMELGVVSDSSGALDLINGSAVEMNFDYKPGFKVGFGMNFP
jgi:hypothetical protein